MIEICLIALLLLALICFAGGALLYIDFVSWILTGERQFQRARRISDKVGIVAAILFLACNWPNSLEWTPYLSLLAPSFVVSFFYATIRKELGPALLEIVVNYLLMIAIPVNTLVGIEEKNWASWMFCTIPLDMLGVMALADNYRLALQGVRDRVVGQTRSGGAQD